MDFHYFAIMKRILILGAGRSSSSLIRYILENTRACSWSLTVGDASLEMAQKKIGSSEFGKAVTFDINDAERSREVVSSSDIVISLLPPQYHPLVALRCLDAGKHFLSASYRYAALLRDFKNSGFEEEALFRLGQCYYNTRMFENARDALNRLLREHPTSNLRGSAQALLQDISKTN